MSETQKIIEYEQRLWHRFIRKTSFLLAIEAVIVVIASFYSGVFVSKLYGFALPEIAGLWCAISGIMVLQVMITESLSAGWFRILGSFVGSLWGGLIATWLGYTVLALGVTMFATVLSLSLIKTKEAFRLACLTAEVVIIVGMVAQNVPPYLNALSRFIESGIGVALAILVTLLFYPIRKKFHLTQK